MSAKNRIFCLCLGCLCFSMSGAQNDTLLNELESSVSPSETLYAYGTFKSTRVLNGHSTERMTGGQLDFRVEHRFGTINQGYYQFFGLDQSTTLISMEYGINDWVMAGLNRTSADKTVSGFSKFSLLRQSTGKRNMPVSVSLLLEASANGIKWTHPEWDYHFSYRFAYVSQLIVARKFTESFSLQLAPVWIHRNMVPLVEDKNDMFALGIGSRYKISRRMSVNAEYYPVLSDTWDQRNHYENSLSFGLDIETGGHVFQLLVTNSSGMIEKDFISQTTGKWLDGGIRLGFNISRVFSFKK